MVSDFVSARGKIVQAVQPLPPVSDCYVCSNKLTLSLICKHPNCVTLKTLKSAILETKLKMKAPNVGIQNKSSVIIDGDDEDEDEGKYRSPCPPVHPGTHSAYLGKTLDQFEIVHGTTLRCSDFLQTYEFNIELKVCPELDGDYRLVGDIEYVIGTAVDEDDNENGGPVSPAIDAVVLDTSPTKAAVAVDRKRKHEESPIDETSAKIAKLDAEIVVNEDDDDDLEMID